jgi:ethanolamine utilization protein EutN
MQLARVIGTLVATQKYAGLEGVKLLIVQPLDKQLQNQGQPVVAADATYLAGTGELVFMVGSREAALALETQFVPVDWAITGIVDELDVQGLANDPPGNLKEHQ